MSDFEKMRLKEIALRAVLMDYLSDDLPSLDEGSPFMLWYENTTDKQPDDMLVWEPFQDWPPDLLRDAISSGVDSKLEELVAQQQKDFAIDAVVAAAKCALADLEGIMPDYERTHPGWQTINDLKSALGGVEQYSFLAGTKRTDPDVQKEKIIVTLEGGLVSGVYGTQKGVSVAVIDYDKQADSEDGVYIPQDDGKFAPAYASVHEVEELNAARFDELYSAVDKHVSIADFDAAKETHSRNGLPYR